MKMIILLSFAVILALSVQKCNNKKTNTGYKGRLEVKGLCMNYTIKLLEGNIDTTKIVAEWKNEVTGKSYTNVFALGSVCTFPPSINEGGEFYFTIDSTTVQNCAVCLAYYPKPLKSLSIKVVNK